MKEKDKGFSGSQVVTEYDAFLAIYDYMALQLGGRFYVEYPNHREVIGVLIGNLRDEEVRSDLELMQSALLNTVSQFGTNVTACSLGGCDNTENHKFMREFLNLVWDARQLTAEWLRGQGIVPGHSVN